MSTMIAASGFPICSPMYSIGAWSRSPSPMTIGAGDVGVVHRLAHGGHGGLVGAVTVSTAHAARRGDGAGLGGTDRLGDDRLVGAQARQRQCLKWRRPVKTIAMWWRSATSIAISSRMLPPGWMIAVTPACAAIWMPSGNGK